MNTRIDIENLQDNSRIFICCLDPIERMSDIELLDTLIYIHSIFKHTDWKYIYLN